VNWVHVNDVAGDEPVEQHPERSYSDAVTVALPYSDTELCPVHALER
jgi:hypothetical protein